MRRMARSYQDLLRSATRCVRATQIDHLAILLVLLVHVLFFPYFPKLGSANELSRLYLTYALIDDQDVEITRFVRTFGDIIDKSAVADSLFSDKPPGTAFVAAPAIGVRRLLGGQPDLAHDLRMARLMVGILPTLLLLLLLRREMQDLGVRPETRGIVLAGTGLGTLAFPYAMLLYGHQLVAVLLYATYFLLRPRPLPRWRAALAGFVAAFCVVVEYQAAIYMFFVVALSLPRKGTTWSTLFAFALGALPPILALAGYHNAAFGSPFKTSYHFVADKFFASVHRQGFMGVGMPRLEPLVGSLFKPSKGLFFFSPLCLLGYAGLAAWWRLRTAGWERALRLAMVTLPVLFVSSMVYWDGGWTVSQRHLTPLIPFLVAPAACLVDRSRWARMLAPGIVMASVMMVGVATLVLPHLPENWANPFFDLTLPLLAKGCLAATPFTTTTSSLPVAVFFASMLVVLLVVAVSRGPTPLRNKVLAVILMVWIPLAWYDFGSRIERRPAPQAEKDRRFFERHCQSAERWTEVKRTSAGSRPRPPR